MNEIQKWQLPLSYITCRKGISEMSAGKIKTPPRERDETRKQNNIWKGAEGANMNWSHAVPFERTAVIR